MHVMYTRGKDVYYLQSQKKAGVFNCGKGESETVEMYAHNLHTEGVHKEHEVICWINW